MTEQPNPEKLFQLGLGFWSSKTLLSAIEIGLFTELAKAPADAATLIKRLGLHGRGAVDFLDSLVALGLLNRDGGKYSNTPETMLFLDRNKPSYIGGMFEMASVRLFKFWANLTTALKTGEPQNELREHGQNAFEELYSDPVRLRGFLQAMTGISMGASMAISRKFPWADYKTFVDVGTAQGGLAVQVALANQHLKGIGFDLAVVKPIFDEYIASFGLSDRLRFEAGSFFTDPLPKADVVVMGHILHDWNMDEKRMLIKKAYDAIPSGGAFIVFEAIIDNDRRQNAFGLLMSLNMLIETPGGFDYTGADCQGWMREAGFRETRVEHLVGPDSMVVGIK